MKSVCGGGVTGATVINIPLQKTAKQQFSVLCDSLRFFCVDNSVSAETNGLALEAKEMWICSTQK